MTEPIPYRTLVVPEHLPFFDHIAELLETRLAAQPSLTITPALWAALCTALAESVQAHRMLAEGGNAAARERLALAEALLVEVTDAECIDDVLPLDTSHLN
ncbi:MAG TPA: hypothetical protein VF746_31505 [Longimicrobium sp.]